MLSLRDILTTLAWACMAFLSAYLGFTTLRYFSLRTDINFLLAKQDFIHDTAWMTAFYIHISSSTLVVFAGPLQFVRKLRVNYTKFHRTLGKLYVGCILFLAAPSGFYMALFANGGRPAEIGFGLLSILWFSFTYLAYKRIRSGDIDAHRSWMIRSYALSFSAITLRVYVPVLSIYFGIDHDIVVPLTAWINWIPNLLVAELIIRRNMK